MFKNISKNISKKFLKTFKKIIIKFQKIFQINVKKIFQKSDAEDFTCQKVNFSCFSRLLGKKFQNVYGPRPYR